jgi:hypothetical protein
MFIKKSHTIIMLAVMFIVPIIAGSQQVSLQFCFLLLLSLYNISAHAFSFFCLQLSPG